MHDTSIPLGWLYLPVAFALGALHAIVLGLATTFSHTAVVILLAQAVMGILVVEAARGARAWLPSDRAMLWLPLASGLFVLGTGVWLLNTH